jgi:hypothetical protein
MEFERLGNGAQFLELVGFRPMGFKQLGNAK